MSGFEHFGDLTGRVAVVTGASRGIGRTIAMAMAASGANVVISARDDEALRRVSHEIVGTGAAAHLVQADVSKPDDTRRLASETLDRFQKADIVVACAGVAGPVKPMHEMSIDEWRQCLATNLDGVFLTFRDFIPGMRERRSGCLIAISSITGKRPLPERTPYAASKMGVIGLVRTLAAELGPDGIRVNSVVPGAVAGERLDNVVNAISHSDRIPPSAALERFTDGAALKRVVEPEEVAAACVYLASDLGAGVTGIDLNVTAGLVMY